MPDWQTNKQVNERTSWKHYAIMYNVYNMSVRSPVRSSITKLEYTIFLHTPTPRLLGIRWFHFVTNTSVTSQTGEEGLAIRICRRRLSIFGHVRRLPEATPAHSALRLFVDVAQAVNRTSGRSGSASEDDPAERGCSRSRTTLGWMLTMPGGSHMTASLGGRYDPWPVKRSTDWLTDRGLVRRVVCLFTSQLSLVPNYTARWQSQYGVNNLPKVVAQQCRGRGSNPRPLDRKSDALPL